MALAVLAMSYFSGVLGKLDQPVKAVCIGSDDMEDHLCVIAIGQVRWCRVRSEQQLTVALFLFGGSLLWVSFASDRWPLVS